jgi:hypothetical protein
MEQHSAPQQVPRAASSFLVVLNYHKAIAVMVGMDMAEREIEMMRLPVSTTLAKFERRSRNSRRLCIGAQWPALRPIRSGVCHRVFVISMFARKITTAFKRIGQNERLCAKGDIDCPTLHPEPRHARNKHPGRRTPQRSVLVHRSFNFN